VRGGSSYATLFLLDDWVVGVDYEGEPFASHGNWFEELVGKHVTEAIWALQAFLTSNLGLDCPPNILRDAFTRANEHGIVEIHVGPTGQAWWEEVGNTAEERVEFCVNLAPFIASGNTEMVGKLLEQVAESPFTELSDFLIEEISVVLTPDSPYARQFSSLPVEVQRAMVELLSQWSYKSGATESLKQLLEYALDSGWQIRLGFSAGLA